MAQSPCHGTYLTAKGFRLVKGAFVEQQKIDSQEFARMWQLPAMGEDVQEQEYNGEAVGAS